MTRFSILKERSLRTVIETAFTDHCLRRFTRDIIRGGRKLPLKDFGRKAAALGVDPDLVRALALIENYRRPAIVRMVEVLLTYCNLILHALAAIPVRNVSLGLFQIKLTTAAEVMGNSAVRARGNWLSTKGSGQGRIERTWLLLKVVRTLTDSTLSDVIGTRYIRRVHGLWRYSTSGTKNDEDFVLFLGRAYNGAENHLAADTFIPYGVVMREVTHELKSLRHESPASPKRQQPARGPLPASPPGAADG